MILYNFYIITHYSQIQQSYQYFLVLLFSILCRYKYSFYLRPSLSLLAFASPYHTQSPDPLCIHTVQIIRSFARLSTVTFYPIFALEAEVYYYRPCLHPFVSCGGSVAHRNHSNYPILAVRNDTGFHTYQETQYSVQRTEDRVSLYHRPFLSL